MYFLTVKTHFDAAHQLRDYPGKCGRVHGHSWEVEMVVAGESLDGTGMLVDFGDLKSLLKSAVGSLDHCFINDFSPFDKINPTAENIARHFYDLLLPEIEKYEIYLKEVKVWESPRAAASYARE